MSETKVRGRPTHKPDDESRRRVQTEAQYGGTQQHIAAIIDISIHTLTKYYSRELERGLSFAVQKKKRDLWTLSETNPDLLKYWLNTFGGIAPRSVLTVQGPNAGPVELAIDLKKLTDEQLEQVITTLAARIAERDGEASS